MSNTSFDQKNWLVSCKVALQNVHTFIYKIGFVPELRDNLSKKTTSCRFGGYIETESSV